MSDTVITKHFYVAGVLTDPTSIKLSDPTGTYGVRRSDTQAVVVADDTAMTKISTGIHQHTFTDPAYDLTYEYYIEVVHDGETYHYNATKAGTVTLTIASLDLITGAMMDIQALAAGEPANPNDVVDVRKVLNMMVMQMQGPPNFLARGLKMWLRTVATLTLSAKAQYMLKSSGGDLDINAPVDVLSALRRTTDDVDTPLKPMTFEEYQAISTKSATGTPTRFIYEKKLSEGYFTLDRVPSDTTDTVIITYLRPVTTVSKDTDNLDFDNAWHNFLRLQLAKRIAPMFPGTDTNSLKLVVAMAGEAKAEVQTFFPEDTDVYFQPELDD